MGMAVKLIEDNSLFVTGDGFEFSIRLNWYRSLPLSCVEIAHLQLDGQNVDMDRVSFKTNGHEYSLAELRDQVEEFWFVLDSAKLHVKLPGIVKTGETHTLSTDILLRFPYIPIGPGKFLVNHNPYQNTLTAKA